MSQVPARAWCNNEVAYLAWRPMGSPTARIDGLLGFMITRVHEDGERRLLPTWVAFKDQSNPDWQQQDSGVWPIQKFSWRDLTLRRSRDSLSVRRPFTCHYEIIPVGFEAPGREPVAGWIKRTETFSSAQPGAYTGTPRPLFICGDAVMTNPITVTWTYGAFTAVFTNGILSTQNLRQQLHTPAGQAPSKGYVLDQVKQPGNAIRAFLTGDVLPTLTDFLGQVGPGDKVYAALYELSDPELVAGLTGLGDRLHLILSTAGEATKTNPVWDRTNQAARQALHGTAGEVIDRLFNNSAHIGHNKFLVRTDVGDRPLALLTGSTNWTPTGLCTQSNNTIITQDATLAQAYLDYWNRLKMDTASFPVQADTGAPNHNVQQKPLRRADGHAYPDADSNPRVWCAPTTLATTKTAATPPDLADVFQLMDQARHAIYFLTFYPSVEGKQSIIEAAVDLGKQRPDLMVMGAVSSPQALPIEGDANGVDDTGDDTDAQGAKIPKPSVYAPKDAPRVLVVRAAAIDTPTGDLQPELLTAGAAIIHDKIVVIDPFSPDCVVITGSHNLGYKASYANDDNLLIIQGNQPLAQAYAVHVLDVYEHYRQRAILEERERDALLKGQPAPSTPQGGFLATTDQWQDAHLSGDKGTELDYFLS
ncbi:phospholipase D-like domain-containing protein [Nitrospirillum sp. BR 11163]|uniref:phospholipase D-like domain-containing protein n=1 Tax=Nitrospirillum sp. BR 11163 TaxID=3104323 RepID=UPI002AFE7F7F|nr:phospholipase D-like domain-containing protein [Nitrospirillum sp. BR 11163]MEA1675229.1 phospholipase D-like domain-containing protein [Nitrospirillum sp. BR 11163]